MKRFEYLSIITNFGCHYKCPYCVVKKNGLSIPKSTVSGLDMVKEAYNQHSCTWVSLSGGGDPLFEIEKHFDWYDRLFEIFDGKPIELHTSYIRNDYPFLMSRFDRVVYHLNSIEQMNQIRRFGNQIVRVVFVVTEDFTNEKLDTIADFVKNSTEIDELSFRQMIADNYETTYYCYDYLKSFHKIKWWYIEQNDYNVYYAENKISYRYKDFEKTT